MKIGEFIEYAREKLGKDFPEAEKRAIAFLMVSHFLGLSKGEIPLYYDRKIKEETSSLLENALQKVAMHYPVQYLLGKVSFLEFELKIVEGVFIPRPETEELVKKTEAEILETFSRQTPLRILEIGTGSGNIAVALAKYFPASFIDTLDINPRASALAKENATKYGVQERINFLTGDLFSYDFTGKYDVLISNPPYIPFSEAKHLPKNVATYEPAEALFAKDEMALEFYEKIFSLAQEFQPFLTAFELFEGTAKEVLKLGKTLFPTRKHSLETDLQGKERFYFMKKA